MPLVAYSACLLLGLEGKAVTVSVFEAAMPPMIFGWCYCHHGRAGATAGQQSDWLWFITEFYQLAALVLVAASLNQQPAANGLAVAAKPAATPDPFWQ